MASENQTQPTSETPCCMDPNNGFCSKTKTFFSLRPPTPFPSPNESLSLPDIVFSLLQQTSTTHSYDLNTIPFLIDSTTGKSLTYTQFLSQTHSLSLSIKKNLPSLSKNDVALIVSPTSFYVPVIYFALLSLDVIISPTNPLGSDLELTHQIQLSRPTIAFASSRSCSKLLSSLPLGVVIIDSPEFNSWLTQYPLKENVVKNNRVEVAQSDVAAILYSSGTTGKVKGVPMTHRNLITLVIGMYHTRSQPDPDQPEPRPVSLFPLPLFHVFGFSMMIRAATFYETLVLMERFDFEGMLRAVEKYKATYMPVAPPLIVALIKSGLTRRYDLSSLMVVRCGGAPFGREVADKFKEKFPHIEIVQGYGLTETGAQAARLIGPEETKQYGAVGRLSKNMEAKIVDPVTGEVLPPDQRGELWLRGPTVMNGYVGDAKATAEALDSEGWLKTGDLCYFDSQGFLYIVDRLKELIKYKGYQVPPAELEHLLQSHPEIADAAVIPYPDDEAGEILMAYVVRKPGSNLTAAQVMDHVAKQVAAYKKIRRVAFVSSIPKSPAGKILRRELVNQAVGGAASKL